jgi:hypothetical protein
MPLVNMWCAQTRDPETAMAIEEARMALYPKIDFREKTGMISEMIPIPGRIMM